MYSRERIVTLFSIFSKSSNTNTLSTACINTTEPIMHNMLIGMRYCFTILVIISYCYYYRYIIANSVSPTNQQ